MVVCCVIVVFVFDVIDEVWFDLVVILWYFLVSFVEVCVVFDEVR